MAVIRKDLGTVTAYAYAVSKGYTGTEAEFAELMASYAEVAEEAAQSASDAENAAERAEAAAATLTVDDALSDTSENPVQNKVITGELTDVKSAIERVADNVSEDFNYTPITSYSTFITGTSNKWSSGINRHCHIERIPENATKVTVKANSTNYAAVAFLTTNAHEQNTTPDYATGSIRITVDAGTTQEFMVPDDAVYLYILKDYDGNDNEPESVVFSQVIFVRKNDFKHTTDSDLWELGTYNSSDGEYYASNTRIRLAKYIGIETNIIAVSALTGYEFAVYAWDAVSGAYVGAWMASNTFSTSGTLKWETWFDLSDYPEYKFKFALRNADNTSSMTVAESSNFIVHGITTDRSLSETGIPADAKSVGDALNILDDAVFDYNSLQFAPITSYSTFITGTSNKWSSGINRHCHIERIPENATKVTVKANSTNYAAVAFLTTNAHEQNTTPDYATGSIRITVDAGTTQELTIPDDAVYMYIQKDYDGNDNEPESIVFNCRTPKTTEVKTYPLGLHEMPDSDTVLNIVKRCRQMTDIKWTPAVDLPRLMLVQRGSVPDAEDAVKQNYLGTFKAGVEYTGVPYGRVSQTMQSYGYDYATLAHYIGLDTFVSSVSNPNSKICQENVGSVSGRRSLIYATVCSGLACYALNVNEVPTANIPSISGLSLIGKLNDNGTLLDDNLIKIGDVLNSYDYHAAIVTDIIRDDYGNIQTIELSDATTGGLADRTYDDGQIGGIARRKGWTREQLYAAGSWGDYSVYRYGGTVPYTPSPYVNVGDEFDMYRTEHFPCMPYEGNNFAFKTGYIPNNVVRILIALHGYGYLRVFKGDDEITGSPFTITDETEYVDVSEISAGDYTAYLCNMSEGSVTNYAYPCKWSIT